MCDESRGLCSSGLKEISCAVVEDNKGGLSTSIGRDNDGTIARVTPQIDISCSKHASGLRAYIGFACRHLLDTCHIRTNAKALGTRFSHRYESSGSTSTHTGS